MGRAVAGRQSVQVLRHRGRAARKPLSAASGVLARYLGSVLGDAFFGTISSFGLRQANGGTTIIAIPRCDASTRPRGCRDKESTGKRPVEHHRGVADRGALRDIRQVVAPAEPMARLMAGQ